jgi:hypothetical protein
MSKKAHQIRHIALAFLLMAGLAGVASADTIQEGTIPEPGKVYSVIFVVGDLDLVWIGGAWRLAGNLPPGIQIAGEVLSQVGSPASLSQPPTALSLTAGVDTFTAFSTTEVATSVPEPYTALLLTAGIAGVAWVNRRRAIARA